MRERPPAWRRQETQSAASLVTVTRWPSRWLLGREPRHCAALSYHGSPVGLGLFLQVWSAMTSKRDSSVLYRHGRTPGGAL